MPFKKTSFFVSILFSLIIIQDNVYAKPDNFIDLMLPQFQIGITLDADAISTVTIAGSSIINGIDADTILEFSEDAIVSSSTPFDKNMSHDIFIRTMKKYKPNIQFINTTEKVFGGNKEGISTLYLIPESNEMTLKNYFDHKGRVYVVSLSSNKNQFTANKKYLDEFLKNLQFPENKIEELSLDSKLLGLKFSVPSSGWRFAKSNQGELIFKFSGAESESFFEQIAFSKNDSHGAELLASHRNDCQALGKTSGSSMVDAEIKKRMGSQDALVCLAHNKVDKSITQLIHVLNHDKIITIKTDFSHKVWRAHKNEFEALLNQIQFYH